MSANPQDHAQVERLSIRLISKYPGLTAQQRRVIASTLLWREMTGDARFALLGFDAKQRPVLSKPEYGEVRYWAVLRSGDPIDAPACFAPKAVKA